MMMKEDTFFVKIILNLAIHFLSLSLSPLSLSLVSDVASAVFSLKEENPRVFISK